MNGGKVRRMAGMLINGGNRAVKKYGNDNFIYPREHVMDTHNKILRNYKKIGCMSMERSIPVSFGNGS